MKHLLVALTVAFLLGVSPGAAAADEKPEPSPTPAKDNRSDFQKGVEAIKRESKGGLRNENADRQMRELERSERPAPKKDD